MTDNNNETEVKIQKEFVFANEPLSEDVRKQHLEYTKEDCIRELRNLAIANPEAFISRNFFRVNSNISESTWNRYFGSFAEFKKAAELVLSRHAHSHERHIAKHASVEKFEAMNKEKTSWESNYDRSSSKKLQTILVGSDQHDIDCDPYYRRLFIDTAARVKPEIIVLNGDLFDLPEFSKYTIDPREFNVIGRIKWVHQFIEDLRNASPDSQIDIIEGNHEYRLLRHLAEATPALIPILSELHGMTISDLLGLKKYEVNYVSRADLSAFNNTDINRELARNYKTYFNSVLFHHFPHGRNHGMPGASGHHHCHKLWDMYNNTYGPYSWYQLGCGHVRRASYTEGEKWSQGFLLAHIDTISKKTQFEYIDVTHEHTFIGGKLYQREKEEINVI